VRLERLVVRGLGVHVDGYLHGSQRIGTGRPRFQLKR
jgi:hypothetical protein